MSFDWCCRCAEPCDFWPVAIEVPTGWQDAECEKCEDVDPNVGLGGLYPLQYFEPWYTWSWTEQQWCVTEHGTVRRSYAVSHWWGPYYGGACFFNAVVTVAVYQAGIIVCEQRWFFWGEGEPDDTEVELHFVMYLTRGTHCEWAACAQDHPDSVTIHMGEPTTTSSTTSSTTTTPP